MKYNLMLVSVSALLAVGCSPLNTQFSCNATASDRCLSIEEVNAMTETHEEHQGMWRERVAITPRKACKSCGQKVRKAHDARTIWVAPWKDASGTLHRDDTLFADIGRQKTTG